MKTIEIQGVRCTMIDGGKLTIQHFPKYDVRVCTIRNEKYVALFPIGKWNVPLQVVPLDIAALAAGKDAWLRDVLVRCYDCKSRVTVGSTQCNGLCEACYDLAGAENSFADGEMTEEQVAPLRKAQSERRAANVAEIAAQRAAK